MDFKNLNNYNVSNYSERFFGVQEGIISGQHDRVEELNTKIYDRNSNEYNTQNSPIFEPRPTSTKQSMFPMLNLRNVPSAQISTFDYDKVCSNHVHIENILLHRMFALQKGADQAVYVPSSTSDLYRIFVPSAPSVQPFPALFVEPTFDSSAHPNYKSHIGNQTFGNNTRVQLRNL
jgi:hypothetical protein